MPPMPTIRGGRPTSAAWASSCVYRHRLFRYTAGVMLRALPLLILALLLAGCSGSRHAELEQAIAEAAEQGRQEARADLADGELRLRVYGLRRPGEAAAYD